MTTAALTVLGGVVVAVITAGGVALGHVYKRLSDVEAEVKSVKAQNRKLWLWARKHVDLYYRHRLEGAPDPDPLPDDE